MMGKSATLAACVVLFAVTMSSAAILRTGDILVVNSSTNGVYQIDPASGNRTVISSTAHGVGAGPALGVHQFGGEVAISPSGEIYVTNTGYYGAAGYVYRIDPTTGNRSILSGDGSLGSFGAGTSMVYPEGLAVVPDSRVRKVEGGSPHPDGHTSSDSFGTVLVGAAAGNDAYSLTNTGQFVADAVVHAPTGDIAIAPGIYSLLPGESHALAFTFDTSTAGNKSGSLAVSNNRNLGDSDEVFNFSGTVLDHANASFDSATDLNTLTIDFGPLALSGTPAVLSAGISNLLATPGFTSSLDFDDITGLGHTGVLTTNLMPASGFLPGGAESFFDVFFDLSTLGSFSAEYTLLFSDQDLPGEATNSLTLLLTGSVFIPEPSTLTISTLGLLGLTFFGRRRRRRAA